MPKIGYATVGSNDQAKAKTFCDALLGRALALGGTDEGTAGVSRPDGYVSYLRDLNGRKLGAFCTGTVRRR